MYYFLFSIYLAISCGWILRIPFIKNTGLGAKMILLLFFIKISAGVFVGWMSNTFFPQNDYWGMHTEGLNEYQLMLSNPHEFFTNIFRSPYHHYEGFFNSVGSYWNDLRNNLILKLLAFCNIFSRGNYYINILFLNFFGFFGHVALYYVFADIYKNRKWASIAGCFLLPSTLYFSSAMYKDLFVFLMLGLFCYAIYFSVEYKLTARRLMLLLFSSICLLLIRNFILIALIPPTIAFIIAAKKRIHPVIAFASVYGSILLLILMLEWLIPSLQPLKIITQKQKDFIDLPTASTELFVNTIYPNLKSFFINIPQAFNHGFLRPGFWESSGLLLPFALELLMYQCLIVAIFLMGSIGKKLNNPFILLAIFFSVTMILIIGFIIPNTGSIIRYRSLYFPMLITPILCSLQLKKKFR